MNCGNRPTRSSSLAQHFGTPKPEEKRAFTRVLQGHIAIDTAVFPNGTTGFMLCVLPPSLHTSLTTSHQRLVGSWATMERRSGYVSPISRWLSNGLTIIWPVIRLSVTYPPHRYRPSLIYWTLKATELVSAMPRSVCCARRYSLPEQAMALARF